MQKGRFTKLSNKSPVSVAIARAFGSRIVLYIQLIATLCLIIQIFSHPPRTFPSFTFIDFLDFFSNLHSSFIAVMHQFFPKKNPTLHIYSYILVYQLRNFCTPSTFNPASCAVRKMRVLFRLSHFSFLVTFGNKVMKILRNLFYILKGKMGKTERKLCN